MNKNHKVKSSVKGKLPTVEEIKDVRRSAEYFREVMRVLQYFEDSRDSSAAEMGMLRIMDLDLPDKSLYITRMHTGERELSTLNFYECRLFRCHLMHLKEFGVLKPDGFLFPSEKGGYIFQGQVMARLTSIGREFGIDVFGSLSKFERLALAKLKDLHKKPATIRRDA